MKLAFAFLADAATLQDSGLFAVIGGGFDVLYGKSFPATKGAMVLIGRIDFTRKECGKTHEVLTEIVAPNGKIVQPVLRLSLTPFLNPRKPKKGNWMTICFNYQNVVFEMEGDYVFRLSVGDRVIGEVPLEAIK